jgi:hypothetical protein
MSSVEHNIEEAIQQDTEEAIDPIEVIYTGQCLSLSRLSTLGFAVGQHPEDGSYHLRISSNSGGGKWSADWSSEADISDIVQGATELTSKSFRVLHEGRSTNGPGFLAAALQELGLIRASTVNKHHFEHVPQATIASLVQGHLGEPNEPKPGRKKGKV